jgi:hypothetical protein
VTTESDDGSKRGAVYVSMVLKALQETNVCKQSASVIGFSKGFIWDLLALAPN